MALKYVRKGFREEARGTHGGFSILHRRAQLDPKQRLLIIYLGVAAVLAGVMVVNALAFNRQTQWRETQEGEGVILEKKRLKSFRGTWAHFIAVRVDVILEESQDPESSQEGEGMAGLVQLVAENVVVDAESWEHVDEGSPVWVTFQVDTRGKRARVLSLVLRELAEEGTGEPEAPDTPILP